MSDAAPESDFWDALGWQPDDNQREQLNELQLLLRDWNSRVNLTRLVDGNDYWVNQVFDSLWALAPELATADCRRECIDVGTGGGFPGLAVAIALPGARMTLVDSVGRKTTAVESMSRSLGLAERVTVVTERIEVMGRQKTFRNQFDIAMARAVASAPVVAEYLVPLLRASGEAHLYRGRWSSEDESDLEQALKPLKARLSRVQQCHLPADRGVRHLLRIQGSAACPSTYPRAVGIPARLPLGQQANR